jgi:hypothetical protein
VSMGAALKDLTLELWMMDDEARTESVLCYRKTLTIFQGLFLHALEA